MLTTINKDGDSHLISLSMLTPLESETLRTALTALILTFPNLSEGADDYEDMKEILDTASDLLNYIPMRDDLITNAPYIKLDSLTQEKDN